MYEIQRKIVQQNPYYVKRYFTGRFQYARTAFGNQ